MPTVYYSLYGNENQITSRRVKKVKMIFREFE